MHRLSSDLNGKPFLAEKHGGNGGSMTAKIKLEYLMKSPLLPCSIWWFFCHQVACIQEQLEDFSCRGRNPVHSTHGCGWYLDAIGWCLSPIPSVKLCNTSASETPEDRHYGIQNFGQ
ncbi:unnamed protein product [Musa acuminata subsp. burmannicoides]